MKTVYKGDPRYEALYEKMQLLGLQDVSTPRQVKNGTIIWQLPIKNNWPKQNPEYIKVGSFSTGYVRNQNSGYSNYQLNKRCMSEPTYYPSHKWVDGKQVPDGKYYKFQTRGCVLIPIEIDRLEYLLKYCIKNYYIKHANQVANGEFYPKWMYESDNLTQDKYNEAYNNGYEAGKNEDDDIQVIINGHRYKMYGAK